MRSVFSIAAVTTLTAIAALFVACGDPPPKAPAPARPPGDNGHTCAVGAKVVNTCKQGLVCRRAPPALPVPTPNGPEMPRGEGGECGGPAGFWCTKNLACDTSRTHDDSGLGNCVRADLCLPPDGADASTN